MQNSILNVQKQAKSTTDSESHSFLNLKLARIPHTRLHRTAWEHIRNPRFKERRGVRPFQLSEKDTVFRVWDHEDIQKETKKWVKNKKILRLHNWKDIGASVLIDFDLNVVSMQNFHVILEQNMWKTKKIKLEISNLNPHKLSIILFYLTRKQSEIQNLSLAIRLENTTERQIHLIRRTILKNLPNLRRLDWIQCGVLSQDAKNISKITRRFTQLKTLFFNFGGMYGSESDILPCVARDIGNNLPTLKQLALYFWENSALTNDTLKSFAEQICRKLVNLNHLHLNLRNCKSFGSAGLKSLSNEISHNLVSLRVLTLVLDGCSRIIESDLVALINQLSSSLPNLKYLFYTDKDYALNVLR